MKTVYADQIPVQPDERRCGHDVLLLTGMLVLGYQVDDVKRLGLPGRKLQMFPKLSDFVLGRTKEDEGCTKEDEGCCYVLGRTKAAVTRP